MQLSFAIVLWELVTSKVHYENLTPFQAALSVRKVMENEHCSLCQGLRLITSELEDILQHVQAPKESTNIPNQR
ncbi:hypothetical protein ZWY2020_011619 [Hordeum vulgare]|nr:hypothetical protein ZWY2020_011619 [Hordeum vulgare]